MTAQPDEAKHKLNDETRAESREVKIQDVAGQAWSLDQFVVEPSTNKVRFHDFSLPLELMRGLAAMNFKYCTPIQAQSLPYSLNGHDIVGRAQTGTGKTAAFLISIVNDLINYAIEEKRYVGDARALILAPTRELALQIAEDALKITQFTNIKVHALVGGLDYGKQLNQIESEHCDILVGTPGRLLDFANNHDIHLDQIEILVIDEADRMLDMGFIPQIRRIVRLTPRKEDRQTLLFSATFSEDVIRLAEQWTEQSVLLELGADKVTTDTVVQKVFITTAVEKFALLNQILSQKKVESVMIFANRRDICRDLHCKLRRKGFKVGILSGDVPQSKRLKTLNSFKIGSIRILVATDVAGRGIHVDDVSHVINYTLPDEPQDYIHRIGRTGRAGHTGVSISFACEDDAFLLEPIENLLGHKLACVMPDIKNNSDYLLGQEGNATNVAGECFPSRQSLLPGQKTKV